MLKYNFTMNISKSKFWRQIASLCFFSVTIIILLNNLFFKDTIFYIPKIYAFGFIFISAIAFVLALLFPLFYEIYKIWMFLLSLFVLAFGNTVIGFIFFVLELNFLKKSNFFERNKKQKQVMLWILFLLVHLSLFRLGKLLFTKAILELILCSLIYTIVYFVNKSGMLEVSFRKFTIEDLFELKDYADEDIAILKMVLIGEKYDYIAKKMHLSESGLKKRIAKLYKMLHVKNRTEFLLRYSS